MMSGWCFTKLLADWELKSKTMKKLQQEAFRERRRLHVVTFDLVVWPYYKVKKDYVIRCCLLYCTLVPGMMSVSVILYEIWPFVRFCDLWPSPVTFSIYQGHLHSITNRFTKCCMLVPSMKFVGTSKWARCAGEQSNRKRIILKEAHKEQTANVARRKHKTQNTTWRSKQ